MDKHTTKTLDHLTRDPQEATSHNPGYSKFIRLAKLIMPLIAVILVAMVFLWNSMNSTVIIPADNGTLSVESIGKNELINPRFESRDEKDQPFAITADRAWQEKTNEDQVSLENPSGEITLNSQEHVAISAAQGDFLQKTQELILRDNVKLAHSSGYTLDTAILYMDLKNAQAGTDTAVFVESQEGTITATGLRADQTKGTLQFLGPATMILKEGLPETWR